jgi:two-component system response regulator PilR (NtrC family)
MTDPIALVVDDEPDIRELLELTLARMQIDSRSVANLTQARAALKDNRFDLCLTDMRLPDGDGLELVGHIQEQYPDLPIAVITAHGNMETAVEALKAGAFDFVSKPVDLQVLRHLVGSALKLGSQKQDRRTRDSLLGNSAIMQTVRSTIAKLARSQAPIYISGESGTGKELVAKLIHAKGPRNEQPFVPVNCGAIPAELMESEFFGHKKGSFTGAISDKEGLFQAADGGTLFLDEVAELPLPMQVKLLRAIQEKAVRPVGGQRETPVDVRVLSATHKNLSDLVDDGAFRKDLYYRINVIELKVPSLRERRQDIRDLAEHILRKLQGKDGQAVLGTSAIEALQRYPFPGNVRELENILERALTLCDGHEIQVEDLHLPILDLDDPDSARLTVLQSPPDGVQLEDYLEDIERTAILKALDQTGQNKTAAAKLLGITFRAMRYRLKKLGLE